MIETPEREPGSLSGTGRDGSPARPRGAGRPHCYSVRCAGRGDVVAHEQAPVPVRLEALVLPPLHVEVELLRWIHPAEVDVQLEIGAVDAPEPVRAPRGASELRRAARPRRFRGRLELRVRADEGAVRVEPDPHASPVAADVLARSFGDDDLHGVPATTSSGGAIVASGLWRCTVK